MEIPAVFLWGSRVAGSAPTPMRSVPAPWAEARRGQPAATAAPVASAPTCRISRLVQSLRVMDAPPIVVVHCSISHAGRRSRSASPSPAESTLPAETCERQ